jgi:hypothetical protein
VWCCFFILYMMFFRQNDHATRLRRGLTGFHFGYPSFPPAK